MLCVHTPDHTLKCANTHDYTSKLSQSQASLLGVGAVHVGELLHGRPPALVFQGGRGVGADARHARRRRLRIGGGHLPFGAFRHPRPRRRIGPPPLLFRRRRHGHYHLGRFLQCRRTHCATHAGLCTSSCITSFLFLFFLLRGGVIAAPAHDVGACGHAPRSPIPACQNQLHAKLEDTKTAQTPVTSSDSAIHILGWTD